MSVKSRRVSQTSQFTFIVEILSEGVYSVMYKSLITWELATTTDDQLEVVRRPDPDYNPKGISDAVLKAAIKKFKQQNS